MGGGRGMESFARTVSHMKSGSDRQRVLHAVLGQVRNAQSRNTQSGTSGARDGPGMLVWNDAVCMSDAK